MFMLMMMMMMMHYTVGASVGDRRTASKIWVGKPEGKWKFGRTKLM